MENHQPTRRNFLRAGMAAAGVPLALQLLPSTAKAIKYSEPVPGSDKVTAYQAERQIWIRWKNAALTSYRAHSTQKYPYFYPLTGPVSGLSLTTDTSLPYPHHRSLWLGCDPLNGGNYWADNELAKGQIRSVDLELGESTPQSAVFTDRCEWVRPDAPSPLRDERKFTVAVLSDRVQVIDAEFKLIAQEDITIEKAKHSLFAIRVAPDIAPIYGGTLVNSEGQTTEDGTYGQAAAWCDYFGRRAANPEVVEGIAIMDHPTNPWAPCPWFTRDYGHLSPSPFNFINEPWRLPKGDSIHLRYRVVLHAGDPQEAGLNKIYKDWTTA